MTRLAVIFSLLVALPVTAGTLQSLMSEDRLRLRAWLTPETEIVVGQEVRLTLELSTPRWFAGGTRIALPEIRNAIVLRRNQFATNFSRREGGTTWVVQQWQIELYPQAARQFRVPPLTLELAVNDAQAGIVRGQIESQPLEFTASIPTALQAVDAWLATPRFTATQHFDRDLNGLQPGEAFTRTVELQATELAAMMLPELLFPGLEGMAAYPDLPELVQRSNRGEATAIRRQTATYVVEREGRYRLPELEFYWWNTRDQQLETTRLPAVEIDAGDAPAGASPPSRITPTTAALFAAAVAALGLSALLIWWLLHRRRARPANFLRQADRALRRGSGQQALSLAYAWLNSRPADTDWLSLRETAARRSTGELSLAVEALLAEVYSARAGESTSRHRSGGHLRQLSRAAPDATERGEVLPLNPRQPRK